MTGLIRAEAVACAVVALGTLDGIEQYGMTAAIVCAAFAICAIACVRTAHRIDKQKAPARRASDRRTHKG